MPKDSLPHWDRCPDLTNLTYDQWPFQEAIYWRYLPYVKPMIQSYVRGQKPLNSIAKKCQKYGASTVPPFSDPGISIDATLWSTVTYGKRHRFFHD